MKKILSFFITMLVLFCLYPAVSFSSTINTSAVNSNISTSLAKDTYDITNKIEYLEDKTLSLTIKDLIKEEYQSVFKINKNDYFPLRYSKSNFWIKVTTNKTPSDNRDYILEFNDWGLNKVLFYNLNSEGIYTEEKSGLDYSYNSRGIKGRNISFELENISKGGTYYFCVYAPLSSVNLSLLLKTEGQYYSDIIMDNQLLGLLLGFLILLAAITLGVFLGTRDRAYLFFSINVFLMAIWIADAVGLINVLVGTKLQLLIHMNISWILLIAGICSIYFAMNFLDTKNQFIRIHKTYIFIMIYLVLQSFVLLLCSFPTKILVLSIAGLLLNVWNMFVAQYAYCKRRYNYIFVYLCSQIIMLAGVCFLVLCTFGLIANNFITHYSYYICIALQFSVIGYGLINKINKSKAELELIVETRTHELNEILLDLQVTQEELIESKVDLKKLLDKVYSLLDNSGEGFLSFKNDYVIDPEYSKECEVIFRKNISGDDILELISLGNKELYKAYDFNMKMIFETNDDFQRDILISLLPKVLEINSKKIRLKYKFLEGPIIMMVLTDITYEKELEDMLLEEQGRLKFIVSSIMNRSDFFETVDYCKKFIKNTLKVTVGINMSPEEKFAQIYRLIHTLKGTVMQLNFVYLPKMLHELETRLTNQKNTFIKKPSTVLSTIEELGFEETINMDLNIITETIGKDFIEEKNKMYLDKEQTIRLERLRAILEKYSSSEDADLLEASEITKTLQYVSIKKLLRIYPKYTLELAERLHKSVFAFTIEGDDFKIAPAKYNTFIKNLIHVFRNAVDHGTETPDERLEAGKDITGRISCIVKTFDGKIFITIKDDGRGINLEKIRAKAIENGLFNEEEARNLSEKELIDLIFHDNFSTKNEATEVSGRGYGLSATKKELDKLGGTVNIETALGQGTQFTFMI